MWGKTPSELLGVTGIYESYCVNEAVWAFGSAVEVAVEEAASQGKNDKLRKANAQNTFRKMMGMEPKFASPPSSR